MSVRVILEQVQLSHGDKRSEELRLLRRRVDLKMQSLYKGAGEFLAGCTNSKLPQNDSTVEVIVNIECYRRSASSLKAEPSKWALVNAFE